MFGLSWSELCVIVIVLLLVVKPTDLPHIAKTIKIFIRKIRLFQYEITKLMKDHDLSGAVDDLKAEAKIIDDEVKTIIDLDGNKQRTYDIADMIKKKDS